MTILGYGRNSISMTHPNLRLFYESMKQRVLMVKTLQMSPAIFSGISLFHFSSPTMRDKLSSITDTQYRQTANEFTQIDLKSFWIMYRIRRTAQNNSNYFRIVFGKLVLR